ncbi:hypothetical protein N9C56_15665 [Paracoccaceae bacterium]|nr:hypothetical protein [Paracoccaceae bacterium]
MLTVFIALSIAVIAAIALEGLSRVGPDDELLEELEDTVVVDDDPEELPDEEVLGKETVSSTKSTRVSSAIIISSSFSVFISSKRFRLVPCWAAKFDKSILISKPSFGTAGRPSIC